MAVKNAVAKSWVIQPSFDGLLYSAYPNGNKPSGFQTSPTLLYTDIVSGPTTGGEGNKGSYISLFGYSFGRQADLGTPSGARVFIGGVEVANYRYMGVSRVYDVLQVVKIICQVGSLGGQTGALDVKVTVNGTDSNVLTGGFYVQPGRFAFVSLTGDDATAVFDDITKPFRYVQNYSGINPVAGSLWAATTAQGEAGLRAGDTIVMRSGTWTDQTGYEGKMCRFKNHTGSAPSGASGHGYIHFVRYPGPINGNAPETVTWACPTNGAGLLQGCGTANAAAGYGKYWTVSGMVMTNAADSAGAPSDAGLINWQNGADYCRVFDCELGPYTWTSPAPSLKTAGVVGVSIGGVIAMNYIHDIGGSSALENHGVYLGGADGNGYQQCSQNCDVGYNWIYNISGGSGFQYNWAATVLSPSLMFTGNTIHHNYIDTCQKFGLNLGPSYVSGTHYNNIILNTVLPGVRIDAELSVGAGATVGGTITYNTIYNCSTSGASENALISNDYLLAGTNSLYIQHNTLVLGVARSSDSTAYYGNYAAPASDAGVLIDQNLYYDPKGVNPTITAKDSHAVTGNPNFTDLTTGGVWNFTANLTNWTCIAGGAGLEGATIAGNYSPANDFYGVARPQSTYRDLGATEGIGT